MEYKSIHKDFHLNGINYSRKELQEVAYSLVKEGEDFEKSIGDFLLDWLNDKSTVQVQTSGSTGKPKKIELWKSHMVNSAKATGVFFGLAPGSSALLCLSADFIAGKMMLVRAIILGLHLDYVEPSSNPLEQHSKTFDFCAMVPLQVENALNKQDQIKTLIVGGAPVAFTLKELMIGKVENSEIFETYGMTETITHVAVKKIHPPESEKQYFKALPEVKISTDNRHCLVIDAPKISNAIITTNDVVNLISDSEFELLGRYDNVINSGGFKLFPEHIEAKLTPLIKQRFFVVGLPDEKLGQKSVLIVEGDIDAEKLFREIKLLDTLSKFEVPKEIRTTLQFQETENGKIRRNDTLRAIQRF